MFVLNSGGFEKYVYTEHLNPSPGNSQYLFFLPLVAFETLIRSRPVSSWSSRPTKSATQRAFQQIPSYYILLHALKLVHSPDGRYPPSSQKLSLRRCQPQRCTPSELRRIELPAVRLRNIEEPCHLCINHTRMQVEGSDVWVLWEKAVRPNFKSDRGLQPKGYKNLPY